MKFKVLFLLLIFIDSAQAARPPAEDESPWLIEVIARDLGELIRRAGGLEIETAEDVTVQSEDGRNVQIVRSDSLSFQITGQTYSFYNDRTFLGQFVPEQAGRVVPRTRFSFTPRAFPGALQAALNVEDQPLTEPVRRSPVVRSTRSELPSLGKLERLLKRSRRETASRHGITVSQYDICGKHIEYILGKVLGRSAFDRVCVPKGFTGRKLKKCLFENGIRHMVGLECQIALDPRRVSKDMGMTNGQLFACKNYMRREFKWGNGSFHTRIGRDKCEDQASIKACIIEIDRRSPYSVFTDCISALEEGAEQRRAEWAQGIN